MTIRRRTPPWARLQILLLLPLFFVWLCSFVVFSDSCCLADCGGNNLGGDIPSVQYYPPLQDDHVDVEPRSMTMLSDDPNRVREEVIAKEVERRLIEEQVRRELALGREVLMERRKHGGPSLHSERSYPFPSTLESVLLHPLHPFERLPLEARKGLRRKVTVKPIVEVGRKPSPPLVC